MKKCTVCNKNKALSEFFDHKNTLDGKQSSCKVCDKNEKARRGREKKLKLIEHFGGKCQKCGYAKCKMALEFHHLNPEEKEFSISKYYYKSFNLLLNEASKCSLLCSNCHREAEEEKLLPTHVFKAKSKQDYKLNYPAGFSRCNKCNEYKKSF